MSRHILMVACLLAGLFVHAQYKRMGVLGSSSANGQLVPTDSAWAMQVRKYYKETAIIDTLHRVAASTMSCYHGMPTGYIPPLNRPLPNISYNITRLLTRFPKPTHIIVNYPSNGYDTMSTAEILFCLETIKNVANAEGVICFIATTQPREDVNHFGSYAKRLILKNLRDTIMQHFGPYAIDFWTELADPITLKRKPQYAHPNDLLHLNANGHTALAEIVEAKDVMNITNNWTGAVDSSWNNPGNWSRNVPPTLEQLVVIAPCANAPVISSDLEIRGMHCTNGASLIIRSGRRLKLTK